MRDYRPGVGGKFILFHGEPGTGKTNMIKTLAHEWREWCHVQYITDPEAFFGEGSQYLTQVLNRTAPKWRLLVIEDAAELIRVDAREASHRQGFSRLLNAVDGLIGQGLNIMVLVTTNEEVGKLHPALTRPGRCASMVEFTSLSREDADVWLNEHGSDAEATGRMTLAELYATVDDARLAPKSKPIGSPKADHKAKFSVEYRKLCTAFEAEHGRERMTVPPSRTRSAWSIPSLCSRFTCRPRRPRRPPVAARSENRGGTMRVRVTARSTTTFHNIDKLADARDAARKQGRRPRAHRALTT
jgi:ATPase family associated with various cellular activities (AAA)